ncbi:MAG: flagellar hook-associated protein FlgK [Treponema sp.]|nr:flagellar hook-associated protein FlgK [Treponema sp.]MCL2272328.1 flagellar hook-associated protein FlgK [Treponema sp.]
MTSTFMGLEIGKRGIQAHQKAQAVTGHNLNNLETKGYSRQRAEFSAFEPIYLPGLNRAETPGQIGQGVVVERIERIRDQLLDKRIIAQASELGYWTARDRYISEMEQLHLVPGLNSVKSKMDSFWDGWQELSQHAADTEFRTAVIERGKTLVDGIHNHFSGLRRLQDQVDSDIQMNVSRVNDLSRQIAALNGDIQRIKAQGDNPNDLMDRRDLLVDELSTIIDVTINQKDPDEYMVHTSGHILVQGQTGRQFEMRKDIDSEGFAHIFWKDTRNEIVFAKGSLGALLELRDGTIEFEIQNLDNMTMNFTDLVNEIHRSAYGANGMTGLNFFSEYPFVTNVNGNYDRSGDGVFDSSYIYRINGTNKLEPQAQIGFDGVITLSASDRQVQVPYYSTDTVTDVITRINNSGAEVVARLNREGSLSLKGTPADLVAGQRVNPDFVIRHVEDSGYFLAGYAGILQQSGAEGAYSWTQADAVAVLAGGAENYALAPIAHPSGWIEVNPSILKDPTSVAAGFGYNGNPANPGNGDAAAAIASIRNTQVMVGRLATFDDYFADSTGRIALLGEQSGINRATQDVMMKDLYDRRQSISGVNIDEELSNMIRYQHGYNASARFITTVNSMLDTLINRMGV